MSELIDHANGSIIKDEIVSGDGTKVACNVLSYLKSLESRLVIIENRIKTLEGLI